MQSSPRELEQREVEQRDVLVLGSGEAGKYIAWNMAASSRKTALIERRYIGGSCPNIACLSSKNVVYSAEVAHTAAQVASFGLHPVEAGGFASKPGRNLRIQIRRRRTADVGIRYSNKGRMHSRRPILSSSSFACNTAADHTFRIAGYSATCRVDVSLSRVIKRRYTPA